MKTELTLTEKLIIRLRSNGRVFCRNFTVADAVMRAVTYPVTIEDAGRGGFMIRVTQ